jgi:N-acetylneuraminic acid mutarotase
MPALATPVHDTAGGVVDGHPTLVGGGNTTGLAVEQSWVRHSWRNIGNLPTTRSDLSVVEWHHHAYAVGGFDGTSQPTSVLRLGLRGAVRPVARLRQGVRYAATVRVGASVFVLGGEVVGRELDTVQQIHLATGQVTTPSRLPVPLGHAMAADVGDRILLMGGRITPDRQTDAMWWFDPGTGRFTRAGRLPTPLSDAAVATHGRRTWLLGGETPAITRTVTEIRFR